MKIDTGSNHSIKLRPYRTPLNQRPIVEKAVKEMLEANIIRRSQSPWSAPIVLIKKKDNSIRFCIDYRKINQITKINSTPLAHIDDILALLETKYLGFVINENEISPDKDKVKVIKSLKSLSTVKEVRSFIGMNSFYRRFIPNFSKKDEPIIELIKKYAKLHWSDTCQKAFEYLKDSLTVVPLLAYPDTSNTYTLYCDASDTCIGECLTQPCEATEKKIHGVKSAEKPIYFLSHKLRTENTCADLLSRAPSKTGQNGEIEIDISDKAFEVNALNSNQFNPKHLASYELLENKTDEEELTKTFENFDMLQEQQKDPEILQIVKQLNSETTKQTVNKKYLLIEEILYYISNSDDDPKPRLYIPDHIKNAVMDSYHDLNGHMCIMKVFYSIKQKYFWPNLYKDLHEYITGYLTCQLRSSKKTKPPLQETDIPPYPFAKIGFDLSGPYPTTLSGNRYIISFVCLFSGWVEAFAVPNKESIQ
ncbi:unnamed protein product [Mytilus coruscus]|uniref:Integrase zinc-binding domain-containing protein n=1 Tax=Mytilus coruscus TaxID=42192 RepID=A0A6J8AKW1_MYTCO|nr:unnamed protein product [Mytilus coruscus]